MPSAAPPSPAPSAPVTIQVLAGWKKALAVFAGLLVRVWSFSLRLTLSAESLRLLNTGNRPVLFVLWHDRLFIAGALAQRFRARRPLHCLISTSKDGAWLAAFFA